MPLTLSGTNGVSGVDGSNTTPSVRGGTSASNGVFYGTNTVSVATNGVERTRVDSSGNLNFITADTGIIFNKTGAVTNSTLNDYETGTWTPNVGGTATYGSRTGYYTKIGTIVYAFGDITINTIGTGSTSVIAGLPFSANANQGGGVSYFANLSANVYFIAPQLNVTNVQFITLTTANNTPNNAPAILTSGSRILFTVVYSTTS